MRLTDFFLENETLKKEWAEELNTCSPARLTRYSREKVWWRCGSGHEWQATPEARTVLGRGCPTCRKQASERVEPNLLTAYPEKAALWHPIRNESLTPENVSSGSHKRVWWRCEQGHEWESMVYSMVQSKHGCPCCAGQVAVSGETDLATRYPELTELWDAERNGELAPKDITPGSKVKVWWKCRKGHSWQAQVCSVALGETGCPYCSGFKAIPGETDLLTMAPEVATQWDREKNGELDPRTISTYSHEKVWWKCGLGHSWKSAPYSRTKEKGSGCPYCTGRKVLPGFNDLATLKPKLAGEWHPTLNISLRPDDVTLGSNKKVWWQCADGHVWQAAIYSRTRKRGSGCPVCMGTVKRRRPHVEAPRRVRQISKQQLEAV